MENLNERDWHRLLEAINRGNCVLLSGPDCVFDPDDLDRTPVSVALARKLAQSLSPNALASADDLAPAYGGSLNSWADRRPNRISPML